MRKKTGIVVICLITFAVAAAALHVAATLTPLVGQVDQTLGLAGVRDPQNVRDLEGCEPAADPLELLVERLASDDRYARFDLRWRERCLQACKKAHWWSRAQYIALMPVAVVPVR